MIQCIEYSPLFQEKLDRFFSKAFESNGFTYEPEGRHADLRKTTPLFIEPGGNFWLLMNGQKTVGTAGLKIIDHANRTGELKCLYILPEFQGKGLAKLLIDTLILQCKKVNVRSIHLDVKTEAEIAIKLYRKYGFNEIPRYNDNPNEVLFMELKLYP